MSRAPTPPLADARWQADMACRDTVARAAQRTDAQDHAGMAELFTEDATLQRPDGTVLQGRAAILAAYQARPTQQITRHLLAGTVVDLTGSAEAQATSMVLVWRGHSADLSGPFGRPAHGPALVGEFHDRLQRCTDGCWRIAQRRAVFVLHRDSVA